MFKKYFKQNGQALVLYALLIPTVFTFMGVAADFGWWYYNQSRLQNAADAAAIAGAKEIMEEGGSIELISKEDTKYNNFINSAKKESNSEASNKALEYAKTNLSEVPQLSDDLYKSDNAVNSDVEYYVVTLNSKANHLFSIMEKFGEMKTLAIAVAKITKIIDGTDLYSEMKKLEEEKVIGNWEIQDAKKVYKGNWNHFQDTASHYKTGDDYRTETITVKAGAERNQFVTGRAIPTYEQEVLDSINIDFKQDVRFKSIFSQDWDLGVTPQVGITIDPTSYKEGWNKQVAFDLRIHSTINIDGAYKVRANQPKPDPLWVRIESEPIINQLKYENWSKTILELNSVRQIIINVNKSNFDTSTEEYRPLVIFYDGPEKLNENSTVRQSQPVIINLNADFRGILFMPNSPVVINGNGHKFEGFVIAKWYKKLKTKESFGSSYEEYTVSSNGNTILIDPNVDGVLTKISDENELKNDMKEITYIRDTKPEDNDITKNATSFKFIIEDSNKWFYFANVKEEYFKTGYDIENIYNRNSYNGNSYDRTKEVHVKKDSVKTINEIGTYDSNIYYKIYLKDDKTKTEFFVKKEDALLHSDGWRRARDKNGQGYVFNVNKGTRIYVTCDGSDVGNSSNSVEYDSNKLYIPKGYTAVKDSQGNKAYINNKLLNDSKNYFQATSEGDKTIYIDKANTNDELYFTKIPNTIECVVKDHKIHEEYDMYVDNKGNVQYREEPIEPETSNPYSQFKPGDKTIFSPQNDFDLSDESYYNSFKIPTLERNMYKYIDYYKDLNKENAKDMFFTTERSKWIR